MSDTGSRREVRVTEPRRSRGTSVTRATGSADQCSESGEDRPVLYADAEGRAALIAVVEG
ncbi:hypothetical protein ACFXOM_34560 [Streptomyces sp. NPDC059169]|uniref:hypothetical protein n=1 Tax=unclassified Streptomyces TaxID=2593676 RepID=UPI003682FEAE